jgi:hypothetical protein
VAEQLAASQEGLSSMQLVNGVADGMNDIRVNI